MNNYDNPHYKPIDDGLTVIKSWSLEKFGAQFDEVKTPQGEFLGTRVTQDGKTYIGQKWVITDEVKDILSKAAELGFPKFWKKDHPQESSFLGHPDCGYMNGVHHIGCSKSEDDPWVFVLGKECLPPKTDAQNIKSITFNKEFLESVKLALNYCHDNQEPIDGPLDNFTKYKIQKRGGKNITTRPTDFNRIIEYIARNL